MRKVSVLVLHRYPFSESSFVVKTLTSEGVILSFLLKGARRKGSPFRMVFDPLVKSEVVYQPSIRRDLQIPRDVSLLRYHSRLREDLLKLAMAQVMSETILRISQGGGCFTAEYELLQGSLAWLDRDGEVPSAFSNIPESHALAFFWWQLAECLGFGFQLTQCVQCHRTFESVPADLWPAMGGGGCAHCLGDRRPGWTTDFLKEIYSFVAHQVTIVLDPSRLESFFLSYLRIHTGQMLELKSLDWLRQSRSLQLSEQGDTYVDPI
ncbi:MAG TPA: DNA repair protein RecO [Fibrobacteraceae bacterium]|nr:DNA repair protein RecO [Fibrobacteraceae bacterium]